VLRPRRGDIISIEAWEGWDMPLYEYVCASCAGKFELYVRSWSEEVVCPSCQGRDVEKQLSTFAFAGGGGPASSGGGCGCGRGGCGCGH
jgi:putative FmdB family regulatory protein